MPASRPELDVELRMELLDRFLRDYEADRSDGKTVRSLHESLQRHIVDDADVFQRLEDRLAEARERAARQDGWNEATGRFHVAPPAPAALSPVTVMLDSRRSKRPSIMPPSWLVKVAAQPLTVVLMALALIASHWLRSCIRP